MKRFSSLPTFALLASDRSNYKRYFVRAILQKDILTRNVASHCCSWETSLWQSNGGL